MDFIGIRAFKRIFNLIALDDVSQIYEDVYRYSRKLEGHDLEARSQLYTSYFLLVLATVHQLATVAFVPRLRSPRLSVILFDGSYIFGLDRLVLVFFALNNLITLYLFRVVYQLLPNSLVGRILRDVLIHNRKDFIQDHRCNLNPVDYLNRFIKIIRQGFYFYLVFSYICTLRMFFQQHSPLSVERIASLDFVLGLLYLLASNTLFNIGLYLYNQICTKAALFHVSTCLIIFQRFRCTKHILVMTRLAGPRRAILRAILVFLREHGHSMQALFSQNRSLVRGLVVHIIFTCPMNACLAVILFRGRVNNFLFVPFVAFILGQLTSIIGIHLLSAEFSRRVHTPFKEINSDYVRLRSFRCPLRDRLRVSNSLWIFLTKKPYGLTYFGYGLISVFSFVKFLFIYFRFAIFAFKYFD